MQLTRLLDSEAVLSQVNAMEEVETYAELVVVKILQASTDRGEASHSGHIGELPCSSSDH